MFWLSKGFFLTAFKQKQFLMPKYHFKNHNDYKLVLLVTYREVNQYFNQEVSNKIQHLLQIQNRIT